MTNQTAAIAGIYVTAVAGGDPVATEVASIEAGRGIVGDRYHIGSGTFSPSENDPDHQITLIALEEIEAFNAAVGGAFPPGAFRRNVVTRGADLNALVGREFRLGVARLRGIRLCEPCTHLAGLLHPEVHQKMVHRAGLRAEILEGGTVRPGDRIETG